ncbi:tail fiber domain-containing protein [Alcaligenaceae bacterium]|nr:tail fiber domain-containing protein [Alcaligenaceae bacterium]
MSHACDLSALVESSDLWLYTTAVTPDGISVSTGGGKGWSKIKWMGASTSQGDITSYRVFGNAGSGHRFESYIGATPAASTDGKYVVIVARHSQAAGRTLFLYNRKEVEAAVNPLNVDPIYAPVAIRGLPDRDGSTLQGLACDGKNIYCLWGFVRPFGKRGVTVHTLQGDLLRTIYVDGPTSDYTRDELLNHPTLGFPNSFEPEGMTLRGDELLVQMIDTWRNSADIVTFEGRNWASVGADNINLPPTSSVKWVETAKAATRGAWNPATTYGIQFGTYRAKKIYSIRAPKGEAGEKPLSSAMTTLVCPAADTSPLDDTKVSVAFNRGADYAVSAWESAGVGHLYNAFRYRDNRLDVFDTREGSNNSGFSSLITSWNGTDQTLAIRSSGAATASGAGVSYYGNGDSTYPGAIREFTDGLNSRSTDLNGTTTFTAKSGYAPLQGNTIGTGNSFEALRSGALIGGIRASSVDVMFAGYNGSDVRLGVASDSGTAFGRWAVINSTGAFEPILDDLYNIGSGSVRVKQVYAAAGTINTSDENEKQKITPIDDAALRAWANVQFCQFKFNNAVAEKGSDARWHFGVIAQRVQAAFNLEGLDAFDYGLLCLDVWDEQPEIIEDGEVIQEYRAAGSRLGVRYDEALALECAYLRNRLNNGEL